ncbi:MAG: hypothetical protein JSU68_10610 [Phycisphaerales bacterium]|nr:MAG: hypothetical protein JSU68_10610 [Phycisphaerales bacterium]
MKPAIHTIGIPTALALGLVISTAKAQPSDTLPEKQQFEAQLHHSYAFIELFPGSFYSEVNGYMRVYLGDPDVPPPPIPGAVGLSVYRVQLTAPDWTGLPPNQFILDPDHLSHGYYNTLTGYIEFALYLTSPEGSLPVPMPLLMQGELFGEYMWVTGNNGSVPDASMALTTGSIRKEIQFSTEVWFTPGVPPYAFNRISDGAWLSEAGWQVQTNDQLLRNFGIMPVVPDAGLDAMCQWGIGPRFFSIETDVWSEPLAMQLGHGDLLAQAGYIERINLEMVTAFLPQPPIPDLGLDAVHRLPNGTHAFSTEDPFFSEALGLWISDGDLLLENGTVLMTIEQLMDSFNPILEPIDLGLDAVFFPDLRPSPSLPGEIWFSTEQGFMDANLGWIEDGDLLSTSGYVVRRNLELMMEFAPLEDLANFGLDGLHVRRVIPGDIDSNNAVNLADFATLALCFGSGPDIGPVPGCSPLQFLASDLDLDADVDLNDFATFACNYSG